MNVSNRMLRASITYALGPIPSSSRPTIPAASADPVADAPMADLSVAPQIADRTADQMAAHLLAEAPEVSADLTGVDKALVRAVVQAADAVVAGDEPMKLGAT